MSLSLKKKYFIVAGIVLLILFGLNSFGQDPSITSFTPTIICQGDEITITGTDLKDVTSVSVGGSPADKVKAVNDKTVTATIPYPLKSGKVSVTTKEGKSATSNETLEIKPVPQPVLTDQTPGRFSDFANCNGSVSYTLTVENNSVAAGGSCDYDIDWGDNTPHFTQTNWQEGSQTTHTYKAQGYFKIIFTITPANGCTKTTSYNFYSGGNPVGGFGSDQPTINLCAPATISFKITGQWYNNTPGTYYYINWGDNSDTTLQHPLNSTNSDQVVTHTYTNTSCPYASYFTATFKAANGCVPSNGSWSPIGIGIKPTASFNVDQTTICINDPICLENTSSAAYSGSTLDCNSPSSYKWDFGDGETSQSTNPACHTYKKPGTYKLKLSATSFCGTDDSTETIVVKDISATPTVITPVTYCQNETATQLTATGANLLWYEEATGGIGKTTAPTPSTSTAGTKTYYVSQTINGQCESPRTAITVIVHALPPAPTVNTPLLLCKGKQAVPLTATGTNLLWYTAVTGGTGSATAPTPSTSNTGTVYYYVSQTTNNCEGPRAMIEVIVEDIPPPPTVTSPVSYCQNQLSSPLMANGTGLLWYTVATGGTGNPAAPTPSTSTPGKAFYYVSSSNHCGESQRTKIEVNVLPGPSATISYTKDVLCNADDDANSPNPPVPVTLNGEQGGTFSVSPSGLSIDPLSGTITPAGAAAGTYTIRYFIRSSGGCADFSTTTSVTISSTPIAEISYRLICSTDDEVSPTINGTHGGVFTSTPGLIIDASTGVISPAESKPGTYGVTYTIAASSPCPGFTAKTNITINKAPDASISYAPTNLCNVKRTAETPNPPVNVNLTGTTGGVYSISPSSGLPMSSDGTLDPSEAQAGNYTITYTIPASGGCAVFTTSATVTVSSTPSATIQYPLICSSDAPVSPQLKGTTGGSYSSSEGLAINSATGIITPANSKPGNYTVTYTIAASAPCPGFSTTTNITITPAPNADISYGKTSFCNTINNNNSNPPVDVILTGVHGGTYSINPSSGLPIDINSGTITPAGATPGTYTVIYTIKAGGGCAAFATSATVIISATPSATISYAGAPFCTGSNNIQQVTLTGTQGGTFTSSPGLSVDARTGAINPSLSKPGIYTVTYTIAPSSPCPGFTTTAVVTINESPSISFDVSKQSVCSGETAVFKPASTVATTVYNWSVKGALPANVEGVTAGKTTGENSAISLMFTNSGTTSETIVIEVIPVNPVSNPCAGLPYELSLTVNPIPAPLKGSTTEFCMHSPSVALTANADAGNTVKWYDENNILLGQPPVINTQNPAQYIFYATQTNMYGCESPASAFAAVVHPVAKITSASYTNPTLCGLPSGSVTLNVVDLNGNAMPELPVTVHYIKFQTAYSIKSKTNAAGQIIIPLTAGTYSDFYVETFGCPSQKIPNVFVLKDPTPPAQPIAGYNAPICTGAVLNLSASSPTSSQIGTINYVWVGPAFGSEPDTSQNTVVSIPNAQTNYNGIYIVYAIQNNCISTPSTFTVEIKQSPAKPVIATKTPLCIGDNLSLSATSSIPGNNTLNYVWNGPGSGFPVNNATAGIAPVTIEDAGVYSITVTSPQTGCSATANTLIEVGGYPIVKFSKDFFNVPTGYTMQITPAITNASDRNILPIAKYEWTPPDNIQCNDAACSLPTLIVKNNICYTVKATNVYGCSGSDTICINTFCTNAQVFIPNAFTPRGLAANSRFMVRGSGIASIKSFRIFNRWGRLVFERNNFAPNDPNYGWDGYINGKLADMGVYVYTADVVCENGTPYQYKGNVTLLQ
ncbi:Ig-like domain-containing protein [Parafilimonas terrae]|uniref:Gliding motility-associated C-terminal domain-containing protein n=1 Tax=Parafilimonas terrae TaxID=1465490 RepID=A0A1I5YHK1_9BACT|nr:PKD domain-containing protein [Parafilimonas terrae]SFQ43655.1 gliding motility-associated C-terminal domain-containing protein [Parafilimonas terrae]